MRVVAEGSEVGTDCGGWARAVLALVVVPTAARELFVLHVRRPAEEDGAFQPHLEDGVLHAVFAQARRVVGVLDLLRPPLQRDAFCVVGFFHGWWEGGVGGCGFC